MPITAQLIITLSFHKGFPGGSLVKNPPANAGDVGLIPGLGRSPGGGPGNPLKYSCLENPMDRGAWQATVHRVAKSWTPLKRLGMHALLVKFITQGRLQELITLSTE